MLVGHQPCSHVRRWQRTAPIPSRTAQSRHQSQLGIDDLDVTHALSLGLHGGRRAAPLWRDQKNGPGIFWGMRPPGGLTCSAWGMVIDTPEAWSLLLVVHKLPKSSPLDGLFSHEQTLNEDQ
jgi:hypothetical protein